jgi:WhiB family transcriptional regulator, redox-sensing transcriptional regulator
VSASLTLSELTLPDTWQELAACRDADADLFFATDESRRQEALTLCASCPVRSECLEHAIVNRETYGIWGGADEHDRKRLVRQRRRAA